MKKEGAIITRLIGHRLGPHGSERVEGQFLVHKFIVYYYSDPPTKLRTKTIQAMPGMTGKSAMERVRELVPGAHNMSWTAH